MTAEEYVSGDEVFDALPPVQRDASVVEQIAKSIQTHDANWETGSRIELGSSAWTPQLMRHEPKAVLYVHLAEELRPFLRSRLTAASDLGWHIHVALPFEALYDPELVRCLGMLDAEVHLIRDVTSYSTDAPSHILTVLTDQNVPVPRWVRTQLGMHAWEQRQHGNSYRRGRRFEGLLGFLLGQTDDLGVRERNLRAATDEIDIVLQVEKISTRCWYEGGVPFLLVEAKNWAEPVGQPEVSNLIVKIGTRRGRSRIGLLFGASGFTSDAKHQELKLATTNLVCVLIGPDQIVGWINADDPDNFLEDLVRKAMLD